MYPGNNSLGLKRRDGAGRNRGLAVALLAGVPAARGGGWPLVSHWRMSAPLVVYLQVAILLLWQGVHWACAQSAPHGFDVVFMLLWQTKQAGMPALI